MTAGRPASTPWARHGFGWYRYMRGCVLMVKTWRDDQEPQSTEVDARRAGGPVLIGYSATSLEQAKAWCERWCDVVMDEVERGRAALEAEPTT